MNRKPMHRHSQAGGDIKSPYNFVPLADKVYEPGWGVRATHDIPFRDGLSGVLECELEVLTPLHVGGEQAGNGPDEPVQDRFGGYIIPGSSLKGMLRNVVSIASFGRFDRFHDQRMSVRDLTPGGRDVYGSVMTYRNDQGEIEPAVRAGWLVRKLVRGQVRWCIQPCEYSRIEHSDLKGICPGIWEGPKRRSAESKYKLWSHEATDFNVSFDVRRDVRGKGRIELVVQRALVHSGGKYEGKLVFTGQPGPSKHMEFVFYFKAGETNPQPVSPSVIRDFISIHAETDEWDYLHKRSPHWIHDQRIPVFFLVKETEHGPAIDSVGLAQMYRLPYKHSIADLRPDVHKRSGEERPLDLADLLFGDAFGREDTPRLKGRVSFGTGRTDDKVSLGEVKELVLNGPKPSFYPAYLEQKPGSQDFHTYSDDARLAGWKRYPAADALREHPGVIENKNILSSLRFIEPGPRFVFKLRFHNLLPVELGALYWALTMGENSQLRHRLGRAKPYGYGEVRISVNADASSVHGTDGAPREVSASLSDAKAAFEDEMERFCKPGRWKSSPQIRALLNMSDPEKSRAQDLMYYKDPGEYQNVKKTRRGEKIATLKRYDR